MECMYVNAASNIFEFAVYLVDLHIHIVQIYSDLALITTMNDNEIIY